MIWANGWAVWLALVLACGSHAAPVEFRENLIPTHIPKNLPEGLGIDHPLAGLRVKTCSSNACGFMSIEVHPKELEKNGDECEISWKGVRTPREGDWIAIYMADADPRTRAPVQYVKASVSGSHMLAGRGSVRIPVTCHRGDMRVVFLKDFAIFKQVIASAGTIRFKNPGEPLRVHLALTMKKREMRVHWVSGPVDNPVVKWNLKGNDSFFEAPAEGTTYTPDDLCGGPASEEGYFDPGMLYSAVMTDLVPGQIYEYTVGDEESGFSNSFSFKAPGDTEKLRIVALGDMGQAFPEPVQDTHDNPASLQTALRINEEKDVDLLFHIGDISYGMGHVADWDRFFDQLGDVVTRVPYMVSIGNHERDWPNTGDRYGISYNSGGECGVVYDKRLIMPQQGPDKPWYSFDMGPVHFLVFSGEHDFYRGSEQHGFMEQDLENVNRAVTPWVVVAGHRPMYLSIERDHVPTGYWHVSLELQNELEDLLKEYKVDMMWAGHHHSYQRTCPVYKQKCSETTANGTALDPVHLVFGAAGAKLYKNYRETRFGKVFIAKHGYLRAEATKTTFRTEFVSNEDGSVLDSYMLAKSGSCDPTHHNCFSYSVES